MLLELDFRVQVSLEIDSSSDWVATYVAIDDTVIPCIEDIQATLDIKISQELGSAIQEAAEMRYEAYLDRKDQTDEHIRHNN